MKAPNVAKSRVHGGVGMPLRVTLWIAVGVWCLVTLWFSLLPVEEVRAWETRLLRNETFVETFPRDWLLWRPRGFSLMGHVAFYFPLGVVAFVAGRVWGWRVFAGMTALALGWGAVAEASQYFVADRTPRWIDLGASWLGVVLGIGVCAGFVWVAARWRAWRGGGRGGEVGKGLA